MPVLVQGGWTCPADTDFKTNYLLQLLYPTGPPVATNTPHILMSHYFTSPSVLLFFLENCVMKLASMVEAFTGPALEATCKLLELFQCHQSYDKPTIFSVPVGEGLAFPLNSKNFSNPQATPTTNNKQWMSLHLQQMI